MALFYFLSASQRIKYLATSALFLALRLPALAAPPPNDEPATAADLPLRVTCALSSGTTVEATPSASPAADGTQADPSDKRADVFYKFIATSPQLELTVTNVQGSLPMAYYGLLKLYTYNAGTYTAAGQGTTTLTTGQLSVGKTYYLRVQTCYRLGTTDQGAAATFGLCARLPPPAASFAPVATYPAPITNYLAKLVMADMNSDGYPDAVVTDGGGLAGVLLNRRNGTFGPLAAYRATYQNMASIAVADMNADGLPDIVTANRHDGTVGVLHQSAGTFDLVGSYSTDTVVVKPYGYSNHSSPEGVALGDVNGDGAPDIVTACSVIRTAGVLLNRKDGTFAPIVSYPTGPNSFPGDVVLGDINHDGYPDLVVANIYQGEIQVLLNRKNGQFAPAVPYATGPNSSPLNVALGDVNKDGNLDIVTANNAARGAGVLLGRGNGTFAPQVFYQGSSSPEAVALGDVNGDTYPDIVLAVEHLRVLVLLNRQDGTFAPGYPFATTLTNAPQDYPSSAVGVAVTDVDLDGRPDIVATNSYDSTVGVLLNTLAATPLAAAPPAAHLAAGPGVYPNPAHTTATVLLPSGAATLTLRDALGRHLGTYPATGPHYELDVRGLAPGLYLLQVQAGPTTYTRQLLVE